MIAEIITIIGNLAMLLTFMLFGGWLEREYLLFSRLFGKKVK